MPPTDPGTRLLDRVQETVRLHGMLEPGDRVLAAVSGGADSTALACILAELAPELEISVDLAHMEHGLRPEDAEDDRRAVQELANGLGARVFFSKSPAAPGGRRVYQSSSLLSR